MMRWVLLVCLVGSAAPAAAQQLVAGQVVDATSGEPVAFAAVGFESSFFGTATNEAGYFTLRVPTSLAADTLWVQHLGYEALALVATDWGEDLRLPLRQTSTELKEVIITPYSPLEIMQFVYEHIPDNYPMQAHGYSAYYGLQLYEDGRTLEFSEADVRIRNPAVGPAWAERAYSLETLTETKKDLDPIKLEDTVKVYLNQTRRAKQLADLQVFGDKVEKQRRKARRQAERDGEEFQEVEGLAFSLGGPTEVMQNTFYNSFTLLHGLLVKEELSKYDLWFEGATTYFGEPVMAIGFDQKQDVNEPGLAGRVLVDLDTYAAVSLEFSLSEQGRDRLIPRAVKAIMWTFGVGFELEEARYVLGYTQQEDGRWYLANAQLALGAWLEDRKLFRANDRGYFRLLHMLVSTDIATDPGADFAAGMPAFNPQKPLTRQMRDDNPAFWQDYQVQIPETFID